MKATKPFDSEQIFRKVLVQLENDMNSVVTEQEQFEAGYETLFNKTVGSYSGAGPNLGGSGIQGQMISGVMQKINISNLESYQSIENGSNYLTEPKRPYFPQLDSYKSLKARNLTKSEAEIVSSDVQEWFQNSGFPNFNSHVYTIGANGTDEEVYILKWINRS